jgi:hypothetical protein
MDENCTIKRIMENRPEGRRRVGRQNNRWIDEVNRISHI